MYDFRWGIEPSELDWKVTRFAAIAPVRASYKLCCAMLRSRFRTARENDIFGWNQVRQVTTLLEREIPCIYRNAFYSVCDHNRADPLAKPFIARIEQLERILP